MDKIVLDEFRNSQMYRELEKHFSSESLPLFEEDVLNIFDRTKCPNCNNCIKNLQEDNDRLRKTNYKLGEELLTLKNKLNKG